MIARFAFILFIAGVWAVPVHESDFDTACGEKYGVTKEVHDNFNPLEDEWTQDIKCYSICEAEHEGVYVNGRFTDEFIAKQTSVADDAKEAEKVVANAMKECFEKVVYDNCEGTYSVLKCAKETAFAAAVAKAFGEVIFEATSSTSSNESSTK